MTNKELKKRLRIESKSFVPNIKNQVLSAVGYSHKVRNKNIFNYSLKTALAFSLVVVLSITLIFLSKTNNIIHSNTIISVDINPSFELEIDDYDKVISIRALNIDAALVLQEDSESFKNKPYYEVIILLVEETESIGYIDKNDPEHRIFVNAFNDNQNREDEINQKLINIIPGLLNEKQFKAQTIFIEKTQEIIKEAKSHHISVGKMNLIYRALELNPLLTIEEAIQLDVKRLNEMARNYSENQIADFKDAYKLSVTLFEQKKQLAIQEAYENKEALLLEIENCRKFVQQNKLSEAKENIDFLISEYFPNLTSIVLVSKQDYINALNIFEISTNTYTIVLLDLINGIYNTQMKSFKDMVRDDIKLSPQAFNFNFSFDTNFPRFEISNHSQSNQKEEKAYGLIQQITSLINVAQSNHQMRHRLMNQINALITEYDDLMESNEISQNFKESQKVKDFEQLYHRFMNN